MNIDDSRYTELFARRYEVNSGKKHPFFGITVDREEIPDFPEKPPDEVRMKQGTKFNLRDITYGNILYIPELSNTYSESTAYWYVDHTLGKGADLRYEIRPVTNILTGSKYILYIGSGILEDKQGLYKDLAIDNDNYLGELPMIEPLSDYYLFYKTGMTEYLLLDYIEGEYL